MTRRARAEAALRESWSPDALADYANVLIADGDPRGELIEMDLGETENRADRMELLVRWLGRPIAAMAYELVRHGFVDITNQRVQYDQSLRGVTDLEMLLDSAGPYVRNLTVTKHVDAVIERLARVSRPWLVKLVISAPRRHELPPVLVEGLIQATPNLETLELVNLETPVPHPWIRRLRLANGNFDGPDMDSVRELDLSWWETPVSRLPLERFPALATLDLSRLQSAVAFRCLRNVQPNRTLRFLRMPAIRSASQIDDLIAFHDLMPRVNTTLTRRYPTPDLARLGDRIVTPEIVPWPSDVTRDQILIVEFASVPVIACSILGLIEDLEDLGFASDAARDDWHWFWRLYDRLAAGIRRAELTGDEAITLCRILFLHEHQRPDVIVLRLETRHCLGW